MRIPHINICGYPGAGKSTVAYLLSQRYNTSWIPRYTTRPRRTGEIDGTEYLFLSNEEFLKRYRASEMLPWDTAVGTKKNPDGTKYHRGTPKPEFWPRPPKDTEIILSVFGTRVAPELKKKIAPDMINICLVGSEAVLLGRVLERFGGDFVGGHWDTILKYGALGVESDFEHVINTDDFDIEGVVQRVEIIAGFKPMQLNLKRLSP
ncbi:MAG: hypothetical protein WD991_00685 [Candidatus Paceibacterota bacterium]